MEFLSFDTAMQIAADRRTRLVAQAGNDRRPHPETPRRRAARRRPHR